METRILWAQHRKDSEVCSPNEFIFGMGKYEAAWLLVETSDLLPLTKQSILMNPKLVSNHIKVKSQGTQIHFPWCHS